MFKNFCHGKRLDFRICRRKNRSYYLSTLTDSFIVIPRLLILILFSFALKTKISLFSIGLMLAALDWAWPSKRYRAQVLSSGECGFTYTSVFSGSNIFRWC